MTAATQTEDWLDVMPAIRLHGYFGTVVSPETGARFTVVGHGVAPERVFVVEQYPRHQEPPRLAHVGALYPHVVRVALDEQDGFGHALRRWWATVPEAAYERAHRTGELDEWDDMGNRHWVGKIDAADRLALARALREVAPC